MTFERGKKETHSTVISFFSLTNLKSAVPGLHTSISNFLSPSYFCKRTLIWIFSLLVRLRNCLDLPQPALYLSPALLAQPLSVLSLE